MDKFKRFGVSILSLEPITEVDSSQTKKQRIVKSFAFFTIFFLRSLL